MMSEEKIKLLNKGERTITVAEGVHFKPMAVMSFPAPLAQKLKKLFGAELQDLEEATQAFTAPAPLAAVDDFGDAKDTKPVEPTAEELQAKAFAAEAEKRGMSVEELTAANLEVQSHIAEGATKEEAEEMVFG
jgi:hypothetical protein